MLKGNFKLGTLREYSQSEGGGLMSDHAEGRGETAIVGDIFNQSYTDHGGNRITVGASTQNKYSAVSQINIDACLFCSSKGKYDSKRHADLINGVGDYQANHGIPAFLEIDVSRFQKALALLASTTFAARCLQRDQDIRYSSRVAEYAPSGIQEVMSARHQARWALEIAFTKPERFSVEQEYRFALIPVGRACEALFTSRMKRRVRDAFRAAIHSEGSASP